MFELSKDHEEFRTLVRDFAEAEVAPHAARWDREHHFPVDLVPKMGDLGLFGMVVPEEFGGAESDFTSLCVAIEELGRVDQSVGITLSAGVGLGINPILTYGTQEQKERWLPDLVAGRALAAFGLTEPEAGSDAGATRTKARLDGDEWVVNGAKAFITNSGTDITSVVTVTTEVSSEPELVMNCLEPLTTHSPSCSVARVAVAPASEPAPGSVRPKPGSRSPATRSGSQVCFCSSVP